jgi:transcriptional regulator with XRE-family HTH domain
MANASKSPDELEVELGKRLRALRLRKNLGQIDLASAAGVAVKSLYNLETGAGSTVETLLRVLKALGITDPIEALAPAPGVSPLAILRSSQPPQRARRKALPKSP